jgi:hypothetical protein
MVGDMQLSEMSPDDAKKVDELQEITRVLSNAADQLARLRAKQKRLVVDLVEREILSQAGAARIARIQRQTVTAWVNTWPGV